MPDDTLSDPLYASHLTTLQTRWDDALDAEGYGAALVAAGLETNYFLDDQPFAFHVNPHLAQWVPHNACPGTVLCVRRGRPPVLHFYQPNDFWHAPPELPKWLLDGVDVHVHHTPEAVLAAALRDARGAGRLALIGPEHEANVDPADHNPASLLTRLSYYRALKTPFEIGCINRATAAAVAGHVAARDAFDAGAAEFDLLNVFLAASGQVATETPYSSIIALNEHAAVLHYQHYDRQPPVQPRSFLIDAGARFRCYASDITRTYSAADDDFAALIAALDVEQQALCAELAPGVSYARYHENMHRRVGRLLRQAGLVTCSPDAAFESGLTTTFLPHGLGHLLGIQTHDVGGRQVDAAGTERPPPERCAALRFTRDVEPDQVFTVEPGLYFIPMLLEELRSTEAGKSVVWAKVEKLIPYGGIRIEDNVLITSSGADNLTRRAFAARD